MVKLRSNDEDDIRARFSWRFLFFVLALAFALLR